MKDGGCEGGPHSSGASAAESIVAFTITDNGSGFTDDNFSSFCTAFSSAKADRGGKGIGRFSWLVICNTADVDSVYAGSDGKWHRRSFRFRAADDWIDSAKEEVVEGVDEFSTVVRLSGINESYTEALRKGTKVIAETGVPRFGWRMSSRMVVPRSSTSRSFSRAW